jgi:S-methylmethionine-dependent homocysteine/selenocysteine methylase
VHLGYVAAGARVLRANTLLARAGIVGDPAALNRRGLALVREAAPAGVWVGASVGAPWPAGTGSRGRVAPVATPSGGRSGANFGAAVRQQAAALAEADFLSLETFLRPEDLDLALSSVRDAYSGPLLAFCTLRSDVPARLDMMSTQRIYGLLGRFLEVAGRHSVSGMGVNCVPPGASLELARDFLARESAVPWGVLPSTSRDPVAVRARLGEGEAARAADREVVAAAEAALDSGAAFIGVCCGGTPQTVRRLAAVLSVAPGTHRRGDPRLEFARRAAALRAKAKSSRQPARRAGPRRPAGERARPGPAPRRPPGGGRRSQPTPQRSGGPHLERGRPSSPPRGAAPRTPRGGRRKPPGGSRPPRGPRRP